MKIKLKVKNKKHQLRIILLIFAIDVFKNELINSVINLQLILLHWLFFRQRVIKKDKTC